MKPLVAIDLFCGAGGLTHGFIKAGIDVVAGIDVDPDCKYPFEYNNRSKFICEDVANITANQLQNLYPKNCTRILMGCAPCQPFSSYTQGRQSDNDERWWLLIAFADLVEKIRPEIVSIENVPRLANHAVYKQFEQRLKDLRYSFEKNLVYCPNYGIPQTRKRLVVLASRLGTIHLIKPTHNPKNYRTVRDVIEYLPVLSAGDISPNDPLHKARKLSDLNLARIKASSPGGSWKNWSEELVADCHRRIEIKTYGSVYGRMEWDKPAPTITTECHGFGNGRFGHPEQDRAISLREAAIIQTFPRRYRFVPPNQPIYFHPIGKLIGNAVPVKLGQVIAKSILRHNEVYHV